MPPTKFKSLSPKATYISPRISRENDGSPYVSKHQKLTLKMQKLNLIISKYTLSYKYKANLPVFYCTDEMVLNLS